MSVSIGLITQIIEKIAPKSWAEEWDNVGLLVGQGAARVERILLTLDGTLKVVEEAETGAAQLIIAHHPIFFRGLKNLREDNAEAQIPLRLIRSGIAYYAAHTNLDQSALSSSWTIGNALGLRQMQILAPVAREAQLAGALRQLKKVHPYEEPADELVPLGNTGEERGYGVIGYLKEPRKLEELWLILQKLFQTGSGITFNSCPPGMRLAGDSQKLIRKIAIANGSGGSFINKALFKGADLFISGDIGHHDLLDALERNLAVADIGHYLSEVPMLYSLRDYLRAEKPLHDLEIRLSSQNSIPWSK
ncbi:MAG: Nif3-like dinuclear metal center hexameric protein [Desulfitobacteriaceae bacterium]|nr:Nif3-like dinuclear metal center hexameric protein [Desulfitobacteriaceae bacterium]MDD4346288.1 Nif3-like dinuclear metal center hexameric protein [Desulfitobacteriaceae bacterium]MDD4400736.1 Nif3-like dinuclear metal center hexameric protein [Desulfitobacteriaceae bacterium]